MTFAIPADLAAHLIRVVHLAAFNDALGHAEGHRSIVRPLPGLESEPTAAHHVRDRGEGARRAEFERGADGAAPGEAEQSAGGAVIHRESLPCHPPSSRRGHFY